MRFAYDDDALWIGARMFSTAPGAIRALVTRHDREGSSEQLIVSLDTHHDRRTAYTFAVTPASVRIEQLRGAARSAIRELLEYGTSGTAVTRNADGSHTVTAGGQTFEIDNEDFNVRSLRSNVVLRWEWRPGSALFLVWQQDQEADRPFGRVRPGDL